VLRAPNYIDGPLSFHVNTAGFPWGRAIGWLFGGGQVGGRQHLDQCKGIKAVDFGYLMGLGNQFARLWHWPALQQRLQQCVQRSAAHHK